MTEQRIGECHCKKVRYEVNIDLQKPVIECNCSHCQIKGLLLSFVNPEDFKLLSGEDTLTEYRFNSKRIAHLFCNSCGVESFARGQDGAGNQKVAINVRALEDVDLKRLSITPFDGRTL